MEYNAAEVMLGVPGRALSLTAEIDAQLSKIGGIPVWHDASTAPTEAPRCGNCGKQLFLIAQVYAPVEGDRSIYVFGCNDIVCSRKVEGWAVVRNQSSATNVSAKVDGDERTEDVAPIQEQAPAKAENSWDLDDDDSDDDDGDVDLNALLAARDQTLAASASQSVDVSHSEKQKTTEAKTSTAPSVTPTTAAAFLHMEARFPARVIETIDEPADELPEGGLTDEDLMAKFSEYMNQAAADEDTSSLEALQAVLRQTQEAKQNGDDNDDDDDDDTSDTASRGVRPQDVDEERYEATPPEVRRLLEFQQRVKRCPTQVLRYAWADKPLWYSSLSPKYSSLTNQRGVPKCSCGQPREYELQLMPHVLSVLPIDDFSGDNAEGSSSSITTTTEGEEKAAPAQQLGRGMDWGTVIVYSCSASCSESATEYAIVQWS